MHAIIREKIPDLAGIAARHRVRRLGIFGSAASDRFDPAASDIDFVVEFEPMTPVEHARAYFGLAEDLARAFGREVDLVELSGGKEPDLPPGGGGDREGDLCRRVRKKLSQNTANGRGHPLPTLP